jgi:hypothetical protein
LRDFVDLLERIVFVHKYFAPLLEISEEIIKIWIPFLDISSGVPLQGWLQEFAHDI